MTTTLIFFVKSCFFIMLALLYILTSDGNIKNRLSRQVGQRIVKVLGGFAWV